MRSLIDRIANKVLGPKVLDDRDVPIWVTRPKRKNVEVFRVVRYTNNSSRDILVDIEVFDGCAQARTYLGPGDVFKLKLKTLIRNLEYLSQDEARDMAETNIQRCIRRVDHCMMSHPGISREVLK